MEGSIVFILIGYFTSFRVCNITNFTREILYSCLLMIIRLLLTPIEFITQDEPFVEEEEDEDELLPPEECESCNDRGGLLYDDIKLVMRSLGMVGCRSDDEVGESHGGDQDGKCKECRLLEGVHELLEEKKASLEELEEAFYVFDRNEDGFISPKELWGVLRRLGWVGMKLEDCERMIRVFDEDGDGRIDFSEFKSLMENAT